MGGPPSPSLRLTDIATTLKSPAHSLFITLVTSEDFMTGIEAEVNIFIYIFIYEAVYGRAGLNPTKVKAVEVIFSPILERARLRARHKKRAQGV